MIKLRFISPLVLITALTLPCFGCAPQRDCKFIFQSTSSDPIIPEAFGVNIDFTEPRPGEMKMLAEAGFRWVRMDLKWEATEKEPGRYDFSTYDVLIASLEPYNIHALFILDYGNPLYDNGAPPRTEVTRQAFARWAVAAARHFAGRGALWEVYNEPNHSMFWPPQPNPQEYVALALAVGRAFRQSAPEEKLIGPATSEIDFEFLEECFKAGLLEYWSAVSIHPYRRTDPETAARDYCRLREMIRSYATKRSGSGNDQVSGAVQGQLNAGTTDMKETPIISSEWGYSSAWPRMSDQKQGQLLARAWLTNVANGISLSIWYDWHDDGVDPNEPEHHFGTVSNAYQKGREPVYDTKPAYQAAKNLTTFFNGYRFEKRVEVGAAEDYLLVFRKAGSQAEPPGNDSGGDRRYAAWTTTSEAHTVLIPLYAGQFKIIGYDGQDKGSLTADQKGTAVTLTNAPVYFR
ncbi:MAG TPA: hypothetical protein VIF64_02800 [Pyrinomonadaceae bacterium]|jgi:hypothetical protein